MRIIVEDRIKQYSPGLQIGLIRANVVNSETSEQLWEELQTACQRISDSYELSWINKRPAIAATRELYKRCGKDPNRYRVSSEALCRRIVKGLGIYRINTLVDLINLVSIGSGYAIGGFDADKIVPNLPSEINDFVVLPPFATLFIETLLLKYLPNSIPQPSLG